MDCRKPVFWSLALLTGMAGCTTTGTPPASTGTPITDPVKLSQINPADIKKETQLPMKEPSPHVCVAYGNAAAAEAAARFDTPLIANHLRDEARIEYQQALRLDPKCLDASLALAKLYRQMDDYDHAVATLTAAAKEHPNSAAVYFELGMIYSSRKDWQPALENLGKAAQLDPENRTCVDTLAYALARAGRTDEALQVFLRVTTEAKAYYNIARMMQHMNQLEVSRQCLQISLQKDPQLQEAQAMLAQLDSGNGAEVQQASYPPTQAGSDQPANQ
jgi:tetratricopeptide (TPR) repeat protein